MRIVIDTNILVSALKSQRGASYKLVSFLPCDKLSIVVSVPLVIEYEDVLKRVELSATITNEDIDVFIDFMCKISEHQNIYFLWRPFLPDPFDDHILEVAVASQCDAIVTYNKRDFQGANKFGLRVLDSRELLAEIGEI
ncbi:MAG: putative toxin-antitoxin system toxin component, PIN family [Desulfosarcina sp.]|nr:putative toxin-antitoxin system toxin component, PIN family [Desulfobacterales bacterium]